MARPTACNGCSTACPGMSKRLATGCSSLPSSALARQKRLASWMRRALPRKGPIRRAYTKQYCGAQGKIEHCQVATLLTYASSRGHVFLDRGLFLPEEWCASDGLRNEMDRREREKQSVK